MELLGMAAEFRSCEMRRVAQMDGGDGYATMGKQLILSNFTFKMVKLVNFVMHILPESFFKKQ